MIFKDYYKILGLESNKVSVDEIKSAYREQAKKFHPDINIGNSEAEAIFKDVNEAYRILSDTTQRKKYDFKWNKYIGNKTKKANATKKTFKEMLLDIFFGGITRPKSVKKVVPEYGEDIDTEIEISLQEAFYGVNKVIKLRAVNGRETSFSFKVPAGVQNHDKIRIVGQGKKGKNGGKNGDLRVDINIKNNDKFQLKGVDIYTEIKVTVGEAALGCKKNIELFGENINIIIPKCCSSGEKLCIPQKGYKNGKGKRGDLYLITKIIFPEELSKEQENLYLNLKKLETQKK